MLQALTSLLAACASSAPQQALAAQLQTHLSSLAQASFNGIPPPQPTTSSAQNRTHKRSSKHDPGLPSLPQHAQGHQAYQPLSQSWSPLDSDSIPGSSQLPSAPGARASGSADTSSLLPGGPGSFGQGFLNTSRPGSASGESFPHHPLCMSCCAGAKASRIQFASIGALLLQTPAWRPYWNGQMQSIETCQA